MQCSQSLEGLSNVYRAIFGVLNIIIGLMALVGNLFIFIAIHKNRSLRTKSNCFLISLAMTDFLVGLVLEPIFVVQMFSASMAENCTLNIARRFFTALLTGSSMGTIAAISYDRFIHLSKTVLYNENMKMRKVVVIISACWILPLISTFLKHVGQMEAVYSACIFIYALLTICVILISYFSIIRIVKRKKSEMKDATNDGNMPGRNTSKRDEKRRLRTETRAAKAIAMVIIIYCITVLPISVYQGLTSVKVISATSIDIGVRLFYSIALTISSANSIINPFIYYFRIPGFRETLKKAVVFSSASVNSQERSQRPT